MTDYQYCSVSQGQQERSYQNRNPRTIDPSWSCWLSSTVANSCQKVNKIRSNWASRREDRRAEANKKRADADPIGSLHSHPYPQVSFLDVPSGPRRKFVTRPRGR